MKKKTRTSNFEIEESKKLAENIVEIIDDKKGRDTALIDLNGLSILFDYFVITSATNERQVRAIANAVEDELAKEGIEPDKIEGKHSERWIVLDYGDVVVHVFHEDDRDFYNLERLWKEGQNITYK